ncbi:MAG TPA: BTAD domain-containing putative transcriptional regulator, partial [Acidimicrobiia bacterium]
MTHAADVVELFGFRDPDAGVQIGLLGPLAVVRHGKPLELSGPKRRALLILLALNVGRPVGRERIIEALWPSRQTGKEESTLRVHVSHIRDELEPSRDGDPEILVTKGSAYMLSAERVAVDVEHFESLRDDARQLLDESPDEALPLLNRALALWRGRPLQDVEYEEFAQDTIRQLEAARIETIEDRAHALVELGDDAAAIDDLESMVRNDPLRERPVLMLMKALYRTGRQSDALRVARRHARSLSEQGLEPSPRLAILEDQILSHDTSLLPPGIVALGDIRPGRSVRGYELREEAGSGTTGVVYRAYQPLVGREVAVKVIHHELAQTPDFVRRFAEEARLVASLEHPHIVPLYDFWREPAGAFLVMRWMSGGSLVDRVSDRLTDEDLGRVFVQISDALDYAHSAGVVHRDIKPANVLFDGSGNAYLCDFRLAVAGIDIGRRDDRAARTVETPYAAPELTRHEGPTVASDIYGLGAMLGDIAAAGNASPSAGIAEVVRVATSPNPGDRYPDMAAFALALHEAVGPTVPTSPKTVRRNPYKGLEPFDEGDQADFYGRDDVVEVLLDSVDTHRLTALIGASGSGKSSVVRAGLIPRLREGALPGSEEWSIVTMVPGIDPFEEFRIGLRDAAFGYGEDSSASGLTELRDGFAAALDGPSSRALLIVDQFEELFSSAVDEETRRRFLDNLIEIATNRRRGIGVLLTLRADFSDRPLTHPGFGELMSKSTILLAPMGLEQVEEVIRRPASRVGVQVEPGLTSEIVRDIASSSAYLPHLQYVLAELFERRTEDRLTVHAYRSLGGVEGVLERRAEATYAALSSEAQLAARQLFLRMVHLGDHGEETRRRLPTTELDGLGRRPAVEAALESFSVARLITHDRDPVSRAPTVEVAHETVISRWTRYRIWIDEARADLLAHRRVSAAADTWSQSGEDPSYLLTGGPLATAWTVATGDRVRLNELERRFVEESRRSEEAQRKNEEERARQEAILARRSRRRLVIGVSTGTVALVIAVLAVFALLQRQRADDLAAAQSRENLAREMASASLANLDSADPDLSLLLAIEAADLTLDAGVEVLPEVVEALHLALINPRSELLAEGAGRPLGGNVLDYSPDGRALAVVADDGGAFVIDPADGEELGRVPAVGAAALGVAFHPEGDTILTTHADAVREWDWRSQRMSRELAAPEGVAFTTATYSEDGRQVAVGGSDGVVRVFATVSRRMFAALEGHEAAVTAIDFDTSGARLVSAGHDQAVLVWDVARGGVLADLRIPFPPPSHAAHVAWNPIADSAFATQGAFAITTNYGEMWLYQATGERVNSFGLGGNPSHAVAFSPEGSFMVAAGADGVARMYGTWTGGEEAFTLPSGGVPLRDAAFNPGKPLDFEVATVGVDGNVRVWRGLLGSELSARNFEYIGPSLAVT